MKCKIELSSEATNDLNQLPDTIQDECLEMLDKLENNIHLGQPLENKYGIDLTGYYKIYFNNAKHRIIYTKTKGTVKVEGISNNIDVAKVVGIGPRNKLKIYRTVGKRIWKIILIIQP